MASITAADAAEKIRSYFRDMVSDILIIYGEKGITPFKKPLMIAVPSLLVLYAGVYSPLSSTLSRTQRRIEGMKAVALYADDYNDAKTRLMAMQRKLPLLKDKADWLSYLINDSARKVGVSIDSQGAQNETEVGAYVVASRPVSATTTYAQFGKWLADMENSPIFVHLTDLSINRDDSRPGTVKVSFTIATVFPKSAGSGAAGAR